MKIEDEYICDPSDIEEMNKNCFCLPLERAKIDKSILGESEVPELKQLLDDRPNLFANTSIFISEENVKAIQRQIDAFEELALLDAYQSDVLDLEDPLDNLQTHTRGLFMGYDFHITNEGPRLIEVNTNAGGAFLVEHLKASLPNESCIGPSERIKESPFFETFQAEWKAAGRETELQTIAIVDEKPDEQYLYPDMLLAKEDLNKHGLKVIICAPNDLAFEQGVLHFENEKIDMVYNRLTDFRLKERSNRVIREAFVSDAIVLSPAPRHHTLYANKSNLTGLLPARLSSMGLSEASVCALGEVPKTFPLTPENADAFWSKRKKFFFKPCAGFGGRATYRGAKITKGVWEKISKGGYIAQEFVPPTTRALKVGEESKELKYDLRVYTYAGQAMLMAARIYQGQTTNFRTEGGGFSTVFTI